MAENDLNQRILPNAYPDTTFYWEGAKEGKLLIQNCVDCEKAYFPPRPFCPKCDSRNVEVIEASGNAKLYSFVISHLPAPGYEPPYVIAVAELSEGPRMMANLVDCTADPDAISLDMALEITFEQRGDMSIPQFRPVTGDPE